jgi:hypothetical protein
MHDWFVIFFFFFFFFFELICVKLSEVLWFFENLDSSNWVGVDAAADVIVEHPSLEPMTWIGC